MVRVSLFSCLLLLLFNSILFAQDLRSNAKSPLQMETDVFENWDSLPPIQLFQRIENSLLPGTDIHVSYFELYEVTNSLLTDILRDKKERIVLTVEFEGLSNHLLLTSHELLKEDSRFVNQDYIDLDITFNSVFYRGTIKDKLNSFVVVSFFEDEIRIVFADATGNYRYSKSNSGFYIANRDADLIDVPEFTCGLNDIANYDDNEDSFDSRASSSNTSCQYVELFFECDFHFRTAMGSEAGVINQVNAIFNEVQTLFFNEYIPLIISDIQVWEFTDPYYNVYDCGSLLEAFAGEIGNNYPGRLAHLLTTKGLADNCGGMAYRDVICSNSYQFGLSQVSTSAIPMFPNNSQSVFIVAHELGHNFGSRHTHWCGWNGGPIDNCTTQEGNNGEPCPSCCSAGPPPASSGGTIMSYCNPNVNFSLGFGAQPGNKIRERYSLATCYSNCNTWVDYNYFSFPPNSNGSFNQPWTNLPAAVNAVQTNGNIFIKSSIGSETPLIDVNKNFTIRTWNGNSIVGQ